MKVENVYFSIHGNNVYCSSTVYCEDGTKIEFRPVFELERAKILFDEVERQARAKFASAATEGLLTGPKTFENGEISQF